MSCDNFKQYNVAYDYWLLIEEFDLPDFAGLFKSKRLRALVYFKVVTVRMSGSAEVTRQCSRHLRHNSFNLPSPALCSPRQKAFFR